MKRFYTLLVCLMIATTASAEVEYFQLYDGNSVREVQTTFDTLKKQGLREFKPSENEGIRSSIADEVTELRRRYVIGPRQLYMIDMTGEPETWFETFVVIVWFTENMLGSNDYKYNYWIYVLPHPEDR